MSGVGPLEPLGAATALVVVDMQRVFAEPTDWQVPSLRDIVPMVRRLTEHRPAAALFTRFVTPPSAEAAPGRWRRYYERWPAVTLDRMPASMLEVIAELMPLAQPGSICDKSTYSAFADGPLPALLKSRRVDTLVLAGVETDVCVLATALDAVDQGYRVVLAVDAVTSGLPASHRATLDVVVPRFDPQIEVATVDRVLTAWQG